MRYTQNEDDAVEVLNKGFLKVFLNIQRYDSGEASFYTWIRTIVINTCLDFIKQKSRLQQHKALDEAVEVSIDADAVHRMDVSALLQMIRQLPPATQAVFNLYVIDEYNHKEMSRMLTISEERVNGTLVKQEKVYSK